MSQSLITKLFPLPFQDTGSQSTISEIQLIDVSPSSQSMVAKEFDFFLDGTIQTQSVISNGFVIPVDTIRESIITLLSVTSVLSIVINSGIRRNDTRNVDISFTVVDFIAASLTNDFIQYSTDGVNFFNATIDWNNIDTTVSFPTTAIGSGSNFNLVWNAYTDIGIGSFTNIYFRIGITDGSRSRSDTIIINALNLEFGLTPDIPSPPNLRVTNVDNTPISKVELAWDIVTDADIRKNYLFTNDKDRKTAEINLVPDYVLAHVRVVNGYKIYGNPTDFTPPGTGTLLADENTLTKTIVVFTDFTISQNEKKVFRIGTVAN